jgi:cytochrome c oxidase subunit 2
MNSALSVSNSATAALLGQGSFWLPPPSSEAAPAVDSVFYLILWTCVIFFTLVIATMVFFVIRYRARPGHDAVKTAAHNNALEVTWTIIPLLIVIYIFYRGFSAYIQMQTGPQNSYEILVKAQKWSWSFTYPNGYNDSDLHVPVDTPVKLIMTSDDVLHSLSIPSFRVKMDCVPGRYTYAWFTGTKPGTFDLYCTEYCGDSHYDMKANVVVHESGGFDGWLEEAANFLEKLPPAEAGEYIYNRRCAQCHSNDGSAKTGPTFKGSFGKQHTMVGGATVAVDENYIRESIMDPQAKIRQGYQPVMPTFKGILSDDEIGYVTEYLKTLK